MRLVRIYNTLLKHFGKQNWWPMEGGFSPREWEVCLGAILTQNTNWGNVEKALMNLRSNGILGYRDILKAGEKRLAGLIRPSGYYNQKARKLMELAEFVSGYGTVDRFLRAVSRHELLGIKGVGKETADSILLYAAGRAYFVVDAYTRRIFSRIGLVGHDSDYEEVRSYFESNLPKDISVYKEFHALIVKLGKEICRKKPLCGSCPLSDKCSWSRVAISV
mgnify:CR=1 FL=1